LFLFVVVVVVFFSKNSAVILLCRPTKARGDDEDVQQQIFVVAIDLEMRARMFVSDESINQINQVVVERELFLCVFPSRHLF